MAHRRSTGTTRRRTALVGVLAAVLTVVTLAPSAGALQGDDAVDPVTGEFEASAEDAAVRVTDPAEDVTETVTGSADQAIDSAGDSGEPVEEAAGTAVETVEQAVEALATTPAPADGHDVDPPAASDDGGRADHGGARGGQQARDTGGGDDSGEGPAAAAGGDGEGPQEETATFAGAPAGGLAFVGLRSSLRSGSEAHATFGAEALPPVVSAPELVEPPLIAAAEQQQLASVRMPGQPASGGWPVTEGSSGAHVPAPLLATATALLLALAGAHALHAAGYLRPSFVSATD